MSQSTEREACEETLVIENDQYLLAASCLGFYRLYEVRHAGQFSYLEDGTLTLQPEIFCDEVSVTARPMKSAIEISEIAGHKGLRMMQFVEWDKEYGEMYRNKLSSAPVEDTRLGCRNDAGVYKVRSEWEQWKAFMTRSLGQLKDYQRPLNP